MGFDRITMDLSAIMIFVATVVLFSPAFAVVFKFMSAWEVKQNAQRDRLAMRMRGETLIGMGGRCPDERGE